MIKLLVKLLTLVIALIVFDFIIGLGLNLCRDRVSDGIYFKIRHSIEDCNDDILIYGACEAEAGIIPKILEDTLNMTCWNAGKDGQGLPFIMSINKCILKRHTPKIAVLITNEDLLSGELLHADKIGILRPFYQKHKEIRQEINKISPIEQYMNFSNLYAFNSSFYYLLRPFIKKKNEIKITNKGWMPKYGQMKKSNKPLIINNFDKLNMKSVELFDEFVKDLTSKGCKVFVVIAPLYNQNVQNSSTIEYFRKKKDIVLIDYNDNKSFIENNLLYSYTTELNIEGATKFTSLLGKKIKNTLNTESAFKNENYGLSLK